MTKKIGLIESKILLYIGNGSAWLLFGIFSIFDNAICDIMGSICLFCGCSSIIISNSSKEKDDEMSKHNMMKAKATAMDLLKIIIAFVLVIDAVIGVLHIFFSEIGDSVKVGLSTTIPMILGITEIMTGCLFLKYERDGE